MAYGLALVTGATSGIGEVFTRELPRKTGLLLTGRDGARLAALAEELAARSFMRRWGRRPRTGKG